MIQFPSVSTRTQMVEVHNLYFILEDAEKSSVLELQCQFQGMSPVVYAPRIKVIHPFCRTFPVNEKVLIYTQYLYYYVTNNRRYI